MDIILDLADEHVVSPLDLYGKAGLAWEARDWRRQAVTIYALVMIGAYLLYFTGAVFSWYFLFDKKLRRHPKFLPGQERKEMWVACTAMPVMNLLTLPIFLAEVRGHSKLYSDVSERGLAYLLASIPMFLMFVDCGIYWIHRAWHHPALYRHIHKEHHRWLVPTPFASHAFTPLDGWGQSLPYHIFVFLLPMHKWLYLGLFVMVNFWTISIHDGNYNVPLALREVVNGCAHHTDHHLYFNYNLGQYLTLWDRIGGTYRSPGAFEGNGPHEQVDRAEMKLEHTERSVSKLA